MSELREGWRWVETDELLALTVEIKRSDIWQLRRHNENERRVIDCLRTRFQFVDHDGTDLEIKQRCVSAFRSWLCDKDGWLNWQGEEAEILEGLESLRGKNLACFCKVDEPCHADVLLELANMDLD